MREKKYFARYKKPLVPLPDLVETHLKSYKWLLEEGVKEVFKDFSPIRDYSEKKFEIEFIGIEISKPKYDEYYAKENKLSYEAPLKARVKLINKTFKSEKEQEVFMADFPLMTSHGTFIVNGVERVVIPQISRSSGISFITEEIKGGNYFGAKIIPGRGAWIEVVSDPDGAIYVRIDKKRKFPVTILLRALGVANNDAILKLFADDEIAKKAIETTITKDPAKTSEESFIEIHKKLRDGDLATPENAKSFVESIFSKEKYDLSEVGRFKFNKRFNKPVNKEDVARRTINADDLVIIISHIIKLNKDPRSLADDIDHLGSRRIRAIGEMLQQKVRVGLTQMKRNIQDRMSTIDTDATLPIQFISPRPLQARLKGFFTTNQLSQFMGQYNILNEIESLRTFSALGPGGLTRERAGIEVRDVHPSHYGRLCPIHTPEGPNIGLILRLSCYARINDFGMIETPYAKVNKGKITDEIVYMDALEEEGFNIAHMAAKIEGDKFVEEKIEVRRGGRPELVDRELVDYIDVATNQGYSIATSMIPFLEHDNANRALMGSNMQKQAIPCIIPEAPLVATGVEGSAARDTGRLVIADMDGVISHSDARKITIKDTAGKEHSYKLVNFSRTNGLTVFHQRPIVNVGDKVKKGAILADTSSSDGGQIALGQNMLVAFMPWGGSNYEDAIILSERLVKNSKFTSIHTDEFIVNVRDTKLGPEITTHDIPNVSESKLAVAIQY